jgi:hypothetical protein
MLWNSGDLGINPNLGQEDCMAFEKNIPAADCDARRWKTLV